MLQVCFRKRDTLPNPISPAANKSFLPVLAEPRPSFCPERTRGPGTVVVIPVVREAPAEAGLRKTRMTPSAELSTAGGANADLCRSPKKNSEQARTRSAYCIYLTVGGLLSEITSRQLMQVDSSSCLVISSDPWLTAVFALAPPRRPHILGGGLLVPPACRGTFSGGAVFYQDVCTLSGLNNRPHLCRQAVHAFGRLQQRLLHSLSQAMELQAARLESSVPRLPTKEDVVHPHKKHLVRICFLCLLYVTHSVIQTQLS